MGFIPERLLMTMMMVIQLFYVTARGTLLRPGVVF